MNAMTQGQSITALTLALVGAALAAADAPVVMTTFTHMEGSFQYPNLAAFQAHASKLRAAMSLFEEYGARMTIETEKSFANACSTYGDNVLAEAVARGHGVGTHCDFGMNSAPTTPELYALNFLANRAPVDALVGPTNNRHCSGGMGESDWIQAASIAGFAFRSEAVALGYLSMPMEVRPPGWTNQYIRSVVSHEPCPLDLADRLKPRRLANALNWDADPGAAHVLIGGGLGRIDIFEESANGSPVGQNPPFTQQDVDLFFAAVDEALLVRDQTHFAKVLVHFAIGALDAADEFRIRQVLGGLRTSYVIPGMMVWGTQGQAYDAFVQWESGEPSDLDGNGLVDGADLAGLLARWGYGTGIGDINFDGVVDGADLGQMLADWSP